MLRLKEAVVIRYHFPLCYIYFGTELFEIEDKDSYYFNLLKKSKWDSEELETELKEFLVENSLVIKSYSVNNIDAKFQKNIYFFENKVLDFNINPLDIQHRINMKKVIILGCGGIGTVVLKNLISFGVKNFLIIDFDEVEKSNLNRQLFFNQRHIGKNKSLLLKEIINDYDDEITVSSMNIKVNELHDLKVACNEYNADFFVNCADNPKNINDIVLEYCSLRKLPCIQGAVGIETGYWGPIYINKSKTDVAKVNEGKESVIGSISSTNMVVGALMANDIIEYWINEEQENLYKKKIINFKNYHIEILENNI